MGIFVNAPGDRLQTFRSVIDRVHAGHVGQEGLGGADIGSGFFSPDVLLPGLQGHAVGFFTAAVDGNPDDPSRHVALEGVAGGKEGGVRPAESPRHPEALGGAENYVRADLPGRRQQRQAEQIRSHGD